MKKQRMGGSTTPFLGRGRHSCL